MGSSTELAARPRGAAGASAHSLLRRATHRLHAQLDRASLLTDLASPLGVSLPQYAATMRALEHAYRRIDFVLTEASHLSPSGLPAYIPRVPAIARDLAAIDPEVCGIRRTPSLSPDSQSLLKVPVTSAGYLGIRYVVEGAQLGNRVICRYLEKIFSDELDRIGSFWRGGPDIQKSWPLLLGCIEKLGGRGDQADAAHAARRSFLHMKVYLTQS